MNDRHLLEQHAITPKKSLGQNFLHDPNALEKIVEIAGLDAGATVLEIGPGTGNLTRVLAAHAARVIAVELDTRLIPLLEAWFRTQPTAVWTERLPAANVPCSPVNDIPTALADPQAVARAMVQSIEHPVTGKIPQLGPVPKLSRTPAQIRSAPPLLGYVGATEKPTSQVYMQSPKEDPIFASWQFGLGRSLAFTSDGRNRWGAEWLAWSAFDTFWQQSVRWMLRSMEEGLLDSMVQIERGEGVITVEALGDNDEFLNNLEISAKLVTPDNVGHDLRLEQTAPGRYQQTFQARDIGPYMVNLTYESLDGRQVSQKTGAEIPYPAEYLRLCLLYTSPSPRDRTRCRMQSSA